ncbi:olfactory receptor 12-like [Talpa occidentalis]|uniref:olfactory receptor 12-like n=1 Tax=Talpa occidentalis TaxID=50954 RepID=UPI00188FCFCC|nr:olfactory receptor 12-like [Talpa occidentalis]
MASRCRGSISADDVVAARLPARPDLCQYLPDPPAAPTPGPAARLAMPPPRWGNLSDTALQGFVLLGFEGGEQTQALLFALFLGLYVVTVLGNLTMIVVITLDARLHSPMYFFLKNLSLVDLCYSSVIAPNALANFFSSSKAISFLGCATQFFFFSLFGTTEAFLLAMMAYDRFMAICRPLRYPVTMRPSACARLVLGSYCGGCVNTLVQTSFTFSLPFCGSRRVNHFFCDVPPLLPLACADTTLNRLVMFGVCGLVIVGTSLAVLVSYGYIAGTILRTRAGSARHKVFSTCGSHLTAVGLFYGTVFVMYAQPGAVESLEQGKVVSVFYTLVIPMLNPLIYSLRNRDVKEALRRLGQRRAGL